MISPASLPPEVSVVVGVRNTESCLAASLDSVLMQTGVSFEVIVVDDGSTDATPRLLAAYAARDARVRILTQPRRGLTRALIAGCAEAMGEFIARQDVGLSTRWLPGRLVRTVAPLRERADVALAACGTRMLSPRGEFLFDECPSDADARAGIATLDLARFRGPSSHAAVTFRKRTYDAVGGYRGEFRLAQDMDLWLRLMERGSLATVPEILVERGISPDGSSGAQNTDQRRFGGLAIEAAALRRAGKPEATVLARASELSSRVPERATRRGRAQGRYFLGSCLRHDDPAAARRWFRDAALAWPFHGRAWIRWATTHGAVQTVERRSMIAADVGSATSRRRCGADYRTISLLIPTWRREAVLIDTVRALLALPRPADEIVIVDQTRHHEAETRVALADWVARGKVRLFRRSEASLPAALNHGFRVARGDVVLCVDDDIIPSPTLVEAHLAAHREFDPGVVAGRVLQPWDVPPRATTPRPGPFTGVTRAYIGEFIGCNFSIGRERVIELGGFDERFVKVAYRNEHELATRLFRTGAHILFDPLAEVRHLQAQAGGVRAFADRLTTARPAHAVGEYYYLLRSRPSGWLRSFLLRPWRNVRTRHHLRRPWWIPFSACAEVLGIFWALSLYARGPRLLRAGPKSAVPPEGPGA